MKQIDEYNIFINLGKVFTPPKDYKKVKLNLVSEIKHNVRHKSRCVDDENLTNIPFESVYSGVCFLCGLRMMIFLAELNQLNILTTDTGNTYLEAKTSERIYIFEGPEFGKRRGCTLLIFK